MRPNVGLKYHKSISSSVTETFCDTWVNDKKTKFKNFAECSAGL